MQFRFRRHFLFWLTPAALPFALLAAMAHLVSHSGDKSAGTSKSLAHKRLCDACLSVEKLLHIPGVKEHRVIVLQSEDVPEPLLLSGLVSFDAGAPICPHPPKTF